MLICTWKKDNFRVTALGNVNVLVYRALSLIFLDLLVSTDELQYICDPLLSNKFLYVYINMYILRRSITFSWILKDFVWIKGRVLFIQGLTGVRYVVVYPVAILMGSTLVGSSFSFLYIRRKCNLSYSAFAICNANLNPSF